MDASAWLPLLVSGVSTPLGAVGILSLRRLSPLALGAVLGLAAGVMLMVSFEELLPESLRLGGLSVTGIGLAAGVLAMAFVHSLWSSPTAAARDRDAALRATGRSVALALAVHDVPEGLALAAGYSASQPLGLLLALAIGLHNLPEGMSIAAPLQAAGVPRPRIVLVSVAVGSVTPVTALVCSMLPRFPGAGVPASLSFAAGIMLAVVGKDALPTGWRCHRVGTLVGTCAGLLVMALLHAAVMQ